jgi:hypothetical protein
MKIQSSDKVHFGKTIKFSNGIKLDFDKNGVAEAGEDGKFLLDKYKGLLFPEGKIPTISKSESVVPKNIANEELREKVAGQARQLESLKGELTKARDGERVWRNKCEELLKEKDVMVITNQKLIKENDSLKQDVEQLKAELKAIPSNDGTDGNKKDDEKDDEKNKTSQDPEKELRKTLSAKSKEKLVEYVEELKFPEGEWRGLNKEKLIEYIVTKVNNTGSGS